MDLWGDAWSALSSAGALMVLTARLDGRPLSDAQRARIIWELEKYAPCYNEAQGSQLLQNAEAVAQTDLERATDSNALGARMVEHGTRILRPRDRSTLRYAIAGAIRTAAMVRPPEPAHVASLHHVWTRSKGEMAIDGAFGSVELGSQDAMRAQQPGMLEALLTSSTPLDRRRRAHALARNAILPVGWDVSRALAFLGCAPLALEGASLSPDQHAQLLQTVAVDILGDVPDAAARDQARAYVDACSPNDPFVFLTHCEDQLAFFADQPKAVQQGVLRCINAIASGFGPITPNKRELVTLAMAVLAQGRGAQWRPRQAPPNAMFVAPAPADRGGNVWSR